jgi:hypothetical protein
VQSAGLADAGNTVIVVEHDMGVLSQSDSDWIIAFSNELLDQLLRISSVLRASLPI